MADRIITLKDDDNNPTYPIAGGMMADSVTAAMLKSNSVTTAKIAGGAVTSDKIDWTTLGYAEVLMSNNQSVSAAQNTIQFDTVDSQSGNIVSGITSNKISLLPGVYLVMCQVFFRWSSSPTANQEIILRIKKNNDSTLICNSLNPAVSGKDSAGAQVFGVASISSGDNIFLTIAPTASGGLENTSKQTRLIIVRIG